jgi:hypothetical protein
MAEGPEERRVTIGVFKKQAVYWVDYYTSGLCKRERAGLDM